MTKDLSNSLNTAARAAAWFRCCPAMRLLEVGWRYDDRYGYPKPARAARCRECGHIQLADIPAPAEWGEVYSTYYPRSNFDPARYRPYSPPRGRLLGWLEGARATAALRVRPGTRVLDIGCGYGEMLGYLGNLGCEVEGTELDNNVAELARRQGFKITIGPFDECNHRSGYFDYVLLNQVLEHSEQPDALLRRIATVLAPGGALVITTPNGGSLLRRIFGSRWIHWHAPYHVHIFTRKSLAGLARAAGYRICLLETLSPSSWLLYQWCHCVGYPAPGHAHPFWSEQVFRTFKQRACYRLLYLGTHASRMNHMITRCLDGLGTGDNLVAILSKA